MASFTGLSGYYKAPNGVTYDYDLHRDGAYFILYKEKGVTNKMIAEAKAYLKANRDVVGFDVVKE